MRSRGHTPYVIPYGGSNPIGASAYALAFEELWGQLSMGIGPAFDRVVFASSSGGTQAGLIVGAKLCGYQGQILGISVDKTGGCLREEVFALLGPTATRVGLQYTFNPDDVQIEDGYLGAGYGILTSAEQAAIRLTAKTEGILVDPVYTGKAMAGLVDLIRTGQIETGERVLFWHTGGLPALFAYASDLTRL
jgi:1-aminocyclopropane-1-carboxylate deaminase/D-cysteine desulfhydrase-like pyridoxal-dependent ACC family enzyme